MANISDAFIEFLIDRNQKAKQEELYHQAKRCVLDYLGVVFAGKTLLGEKGSLLIGQYPSLETGASVIGCRTRKSTDTAAFLNGFISHVAELDDGVNSGIVHPGTPILSAMFSLANLRNVKGRDFLRAIVVGYEAAIRLANAVQPSHKKRGYHATGTIGAVGASVALSVMLSNQRGILKNAFSAALISAGGTLKALENGSQLKPFNVGNAARAGLTAYLIAEAGFKGPDDPLGGSFGFLNMKSDTYELSKLIPESQAYAIYDIYIKPYAACRYCHPAIEAALRLISTHHFKAENIESIHISTYDLAVKNHDHTNVTNMSSAKMSIPFSVATALKHGKAGIGEFSEACVNNLDIQTLTKKVKVYSDPDYSASFPEKSIAEVKILLQDGRILGEKVDYPKGEPENPLSDVEVEEKFKHLASIADISDHTAKTIIKIIWALENDMQNLYLHF